MFFPSACAGCGAAGSVLCPACVAACRAPVRLRTGSLDVTAAGRYEGPLRSAILAYKRGRRDAGEILADLLGECVRERLGAQTVLVPVPTAAARRRERGFDQGVRLAQRLAAGAGCPLVLALRRRDGGAQRGRSRAGRLRACGHFACVAPRLVEGTEILLVDDVVTTGATLLDCADTLRACGARVRGAVVLAYA